MDKLREALRAFVRSAYPVATEIDPRGYRWSDAYLDEALALARAALAEPVADEPATSGHCANKKQPGGCPLHNLECGYPECDTRPAAAPAELETRGDEPVGYVDAGELRNIGVNGFEPPISKAPVSEWDVPLYTRPAPAPAEQGEHPPLPEPTVYTQEAEIRFAIANPGRAGSFYAAPDKATDIELFTEDRMRAYVDADRAQRAPLTDEQMLQCLRSIGLPIPMGLTRDVGSYEVTKPTYFLELFVRAIERAHGIGAKP